MLTNFAGDEPIDQVQLEDDLVDMDIMGDGDDDEEIMDDNEVPDDVSTLKLNNSPIN